MTVIFLKLSENRKRVNTVLFHKAKITLIPKFDNSIRGQKMCKSISLINFCKLLNQLQTYLVLLLFALRHFLQIEHLCQPCFKQVYWCHFSSNICLLQVSVAYFGNSLNILKFFIITTFVMVIYDE